MCTPRGSLRRNVAFRSLAYDYRGVGRTLLYNSKSLAGLLRVAAVAASLYGTAIECSANSSWKKWTHVEQNTATEAKTGNPVCEQLTKNVSRRIDSVRALEKDIAKASDAPPSSLFGALEGLMGGSQPNTAMTEKRKKIASERRVAEDLNAMLRASQCQPVDIEQELARGATAGPSSPTAPDVPNILPEVPLPAAR